MKALVVDDDEVTRFLHSELLTEWGYDAQTAESADEAWEILERDSSPRLLLVDWVMPGTDGLELCRRIRATSEGRSRYILLVTGKTEKEDLAAGLGAGADDFLSKPVDAAELKSRVAVGARTLHSEQTLVQQNQKLDEYASRMEALAEERARQLIHAERLALLGTLTASIAHDISGSVNLVEMGTAVLRRLWDRVDRRLRDCVAADADDAQDLEDVLREVPETLDDLRLGADRSIALVRRLQRFARKDDEDLRLCSVNECISSSLRICRPRLGGGIEVRQELDERAPAVRADPRQLEQVVANLLVNAIDAMSESGQGTLSIGSSHGDGKVLVVIEDTGPGIAEEILDCLWEPFCTTKRADQGTGLGLFICQGIVKKLRGSLSAENLPGGGARFTLELPTA